MGVAGVAIFEPTSGALLRTLSVPADLTMWVAFDASGTRLIAGDGVGNVTIWDASSWRRIVSAPTGLGVLLGGGIDAETGRVWVLADALYSLDIGQPPLLERALKVDLDHVAVALPAGKGSLLTADQTGVSIVDASSGTVLLREGGGSATALAVGPDDTTIVVGREDGRVQLLDANTLASRIELGALGSRIDAVAVRSGEEPLVAAATDRIVTIWSTGDRSAEVRFDHDFGQSIGIRAGIAFTPDGSTLAANFNGGMAAIDLNSLDLHFAPPAPGFGGMIVADPLGRGFYLAAVGAFPALVDADLAVTTSMPDTSAGVGAGAISPDGAYAVTGALDGTIALLDVESRSQYGSFIQTPFGGVSSLAFVPDSLTMMTAHSAEDGSSTIAFWNLDPDFLVERACEISGRDLTDAEWDTYLPGYEHTPICPVGG
jgi:WD40 repeat protein